MSIGVAMRPLTLPAQSVIGANTNFTLLISGNGTLSPHHSTFQDGTKYTAAAIPAKGSLFANWTSNGILVSTGPRYTFMVESNLVLQANFVTNPFIPIDGTYHGLFYVTNNASEESSGAFVATVASTGAFTAQLRTAAQTHAFSGKFSLAGMASASIPRTGLPPFTVQINLGLTNGSLTGTVSDGTWVADLSADRANSSKANPAPQAGRYTLLIPGSDNASAQPAGHGFGAVTVDALGRVTLSGILGDGTTVTSASIVSRQGRWPFYAPLYNGKGSILGWLSFTNQGNVSGQLGWFKLLQPKARLYPGGFTNSTEVVGSVYGYTNGLPVLGLTGGQLSLTNGNLAQSISNPVVLGPNFHAAVQEASVQKTNKLAFKTSSGMFKGTVMNPATGKPITVNGVILQNQDLGAGYFLGSTESGSVILSGTGSVTGPNLAAALGEPSNTTTVVSEPAPSYVKTNNFSVEALPQNVPLGSWLLNNTNYTGEEGQVPFMSGVPFVPDWNGMAVAMTNTETLNPLMYNVVESNGRTNVNCANGTIRFWFQPNWSSGSAEAPSDGRFFQVGGADSGIFALIVANIGTNNGSVMQFICGSNQYWQGCSFGIGGTNGAPIHFQSNHWYQIALAYTATNIALYTNGALLATGNLPPTFVTPAPYTQTPIYSVGNGVSYYPSATAQSSGFGFGNFNGKYPVLGQLANLETFNNALAPQAVAAGFPTFAGSITNVMLDSDYDGRSDLLESLVDGTDPNNPASVVQCSLGYWRFDSATLMTEQGQPPLSYNDIGLAPSWSGTALNINSDPASQVTYWDVFTNGWANINCRQGSLRFWFKPNASGGQGGPFVYMGSPDGVDKWELALDSWAGSISFITGSNGVATTNLTADCKMSPTNWMQIVLTYGSNTSSLFINGTLAATGKAVSYWPSLTNRNLGMVIGNNTAYNNSINGQFDEIETFNYPLDPTNILSNFQIVQSVDSDLNGIPDFLEDIVLPVSRPFLSAPVVITGTIEAEQFDMGGPEIAYHAAASNSSSSYRPTGMFITNCDDLGLGYCLDQTRAGEWVQYTINVLVAQPYTVETRVAGIETGGMFECEFTGDSFYTNTGPLAITTTQWTNVSGVVYLTNGIYTMKLRCLANGTDGQHVGRFNYISIYPWWQAGFTSSYTNSILEAHLSTNNDWMDATNNAAVIQKAIDTLPATGGTVLLPSGTFYVSQVRPCETNDAYRNSAISILTNNVDLAGAGKTNTTLIAYNRATTVLCLGIRNDIPAQCTNFTLRDMTIEGQPHWAVSNITGTNIIYDAEPLNPGQINDLNTNVTNGPTTGAQTVVYEHTSNEWPHNILITNCQFLHGWNSVMLNGPMISNVLVRACDFNMWSGSDTNFGNAGIFGGAMNLVVIENTFNGNMDLAPSTNGYAGTPQSKWLAPPGFVWLIQGGNLFVARNSISNYYLEAVQVNAGPNSIVGNIFQTLVNVASCCALCETGGAAVWAWGRPGITNFENATCFIGNSVYGGRQGFETPGTDTPYTYNCSGNWFHLYPPFAEINDCPGAAAMAYGCQTASVCGNTLDSGGHGFMFSGTNATALILNNNFSGATYRGIGYLSASDYVNSAQIFGNILGQGSTFHVELPSANSFGWFLGQNEYLDAANKSVPPFLDPISSAVHITD